MNKPRPGDKVEIRLKRPKNIGPDEVGMMPLPKGVVRASVKVLRTDATAVVEWNAFCAKRWKGGTDAGEFEIVKNLGKDAPMPVPAGRPPKQAGKTAPAPDPKASAPSNGGKKNGGSK